ncbi:hypothetical protein EON73_00090 [bacterium]|nr:MAG: hypothetical protein EON73_00090 [bacterium]
MQAIQSLQSVQKLCFCKYKLCKALSKNKVYPKPKFIQNPRFWKEGSTSFVSFRSMVLAFHTSFA